MRTYRAFDGFAGGGVGGVGTGAELARGTEREVDAAADAAARRLGREVVKFAYSEHGRLLLGQEGVWTSVIPYEVCAGCGTAHGGYTGEGCLRGVQS